MENKYASFSECLEQILLRREMTAAQLSRILGHKSRTTLSRIFGKSAGSDSIRKVYSEIRSCSELRLTDEERKALATGVEVDEVGANMLRARHEIRQLLRPAEKIDRPITIRTDTGEIFLSSITEKMSLAEYSEVLVLNCAWRSLASEMHTLLNTVRKDKLSVRHYMAINRDTARTAAMIGTMIGLFGFEHYRCWSISGGDDPTGTLAFMGLNGIAIRIRTGECTEEYQLLFSGEYSGVMLKAPGVYDCWERYLKELIQDACSIKTTYPPVASAEDYVAFTDTYRRVEENRNIYMYKPDFCLPLIPTHILLAACTDHTNSMTDKLPNFSQTKERLAQIQEDRFSNIFGQKKAVHLVLFPSAIRKFALSGCQSDHFYLLRPYTRKERMEILSHLIHQLKTNPYFNIYLLREDQSYLEVEATCYEGHGVQFTPAYTDYNLSSGHTEAIITNEAFCDLFRQFFLDDLLKHHVDSSAAAVVLMEELLDTLSGQPE